MIVIVVILMSVYNVVLYLVGILVLGWELGKIYKLFKCFNDNFMKIDYY